MKSIDRYMARLIAVPMLACLVITAMLLILDRIRLLLEFVASEGGPVSVVWRMLANLLPEYLGLGIPIGLLLGILLAFRRLATSSELDVLRAVGMSYPRLLRVPYMFAIALALLNLAIVGFIQPGARYTYEKLRFELRTGALGASIKVGEFTHFPNGATVRSEDSRDEGRTLSGIFVQYAGKKGDWYAVTAERGQFLATDNPDEIIFRLSNGTLINNAPDFVTPRVLTFTSHDLPIPLPKYESFRTRGGLNLERTLPELVRIGHDAHASEQDRDISFPARRSALDVLPAVAGAGARHPAQAFDLGARRIPVGGDGGRLSQGQRIWAGARRARQDRPVLRAVGALRRLCRDLQLDVLRHRVRPGRSADRGA